MKIFAALGLLLALAPQAWAAECAFAQNTPRPGWVAGSPTLDGFYTGVGQAAAGEWDITQQIAVAKSAALKDVTNSIRVSVKTEFNVAETATTGRDGELRTEQSATSNTETKAELQLNDVRTDEIWTDPTSCAVWIRVKVARAVVEALLARDEQLTKLKRLRGLLGQAEQASLAVVARTQALDEAEPMVSQIDYRVANDGSTADFFFGQIARLRDLLRGASALFTGISGQLAQARELLQKARLEKTLAAQAGFALQARSLLTGISAQSPFNTAPDYWPEEALSALADYESFSGNPCEARHLLDDLARRAKGSWQAQAQQKSAVLTCGPEQKQTRAWRNLFFGREVTLHCVYKGGGAAASWDRACADQASLITAHGALKLDQPAAAAAWAASEQCAQGCKRPGVQLFITAGGQLKKRDNPQNPMGKDHQFSGQISSFVVRDGTLEFADIYSGVGGWNPVSSDMAMDVLAIQSGRRFRDKASAYYAKE